MKTTEQMTHCDLILYLLRAAQGRFVGDLYMQNVIVHSRVAELRKKGHKIECRRFNQGDFRYRLVEEKSE